MQTHRRVIDWLELSDQGLRLRCGDLTAQEIRTIRAVLNAIVSPNAIAAGRAESATLPQNQTP